MRKIFFAPINFQVFLKHPPSQKKSIGILGDKIRRWEVLEKKRTDRQEHGHPQIIKNYKKIQPRYGLCTQACCVLSKFSFLVIKMDALV